MGLVIVDSSVYIPDNMVLNDVYEKKFSREEGWIEQLTGIKTRHLADASEASSDLAVNALIPLLERNKDPIDFFICATSTPDSLLPSTANKICRKLGLRESLFCFDIMAACSSFLFAMSIANAYLSSGMYKRGIIVGAEKMSAIINQDDPNTSSLFGDAAGVFLVEHKQAIGIMASFMGSDSVGSDKLYIRSGGSEYPLSAESLENKDNYVKMQGRDVFHNAVNRMTESIQQVLRQTQTPIADVQYIISHQANKRIIDAVYKNLGHPDLNMCEIIHDYGNIVNASLPVAYHTFRDEIKPGSIIIFVTFGAGYGYGAHLMKV